MTLQQLLGELQTLSLAYPETTPVRISEVDSEYDVQSVEVQSHSGGVEIHIKG
jgi:hypothetical protein